MRGTGSLSGVSMRHSTIQTYEKDSFQKSLVFIGIAAVCAMTAWLGGEEKLYICAVIMIIIGFAVMFVAPETEIVFRGASKQVFIKNYSRFKSESRVVSYNSIHDVFVNERDDTDGDSYPFRTYKYSAAIRLRGGEKILVSPESRSRSDAETIVQNLRDHLSHT